MRSAPASASVHRSILTPARRRLTYDIRVRNDGPAPATGVIVLEELAAGARFESATARRGSCAELASMVRRDLGALALADGDDRRAVTPTAQRTIAARATVQANEPDADTLDNAARVMTRVEPAADVSPRFAESPDPARLRGDLTYRAEVANAGPSTAGTAAITVTLPDSVGLLLAAQTVRAPRPYTHVCPSLTDEALLAGFRAREPATAAAFVRRFQGRVFGLALTIIGDRAEAEDAAQETFLRAWRYADGYDPRRGPVDTWLLAIGRNVAIDHARVRRTQPIDPCALLRLETTDPEALPDERQIAADEAAELRSAIVTLPAEQRRALVLAAFFGRTAREIGALEDAPLGTIKTRIRTATLKLHAILEVRDG